MSSHRGRMPGDGAMPEFSELLLFCGAVGLVGQIAPFLALVVAVPIAEHDLIADTVSDLARGPHKWIMDGGFYFNAAGLLALSIGSAHLHLGRRAWSAGILCLAFLALVITLLGLWDELQAADPPGRTVHVWLTFLLAPLYLAGPLLMAPGVARIGRVLPYLFWASAGLWAIFAVAFKVAPDGYDGALEKIAIAATGLWTIPLSVTIFRRGLKGPVEQGA